MLNIHQRLPGILIQDATNLFVVGGPVFFVGVLDQNLGEILHVDSLRAVSIETADGEVLYVAPEAAGELVLDARTSAYMRDLMQAVVREGTGRNAAVWGLEAAGKTGTTNEFRDAWFAGYAGDLVTVVWTGNDDNSPTDHATGGGPPARIFGAYMREAPRDGIGSQPVLAALPNPPAAAADPLADVLDSQPDPELAEEAETSDPIAAFLASLGGPDSE